MKEEKRRREMSTGSRENKRGSTEEKTNPGNRGGAGRRPQTSWVLSLHCPATGADTAPHHHHPQCEAHGTADAAADTALTGQVPALLSKRPARTAGSTFLFPACPSEQGTGKQASPLPFLAPKQLAACGPVLLATLGGASW